MPSPSESEQRPNRAEIISISTLAERDLEAFLAECRSEFGMVGTGAKLARGCAEFGLDVQERTARKWLSRQRVPSGLQIFAVRRVIGLRRNKRNHRQALAEVARLEARVAEARTLAGLLV